LIVRPSGTEPIVRVTVEAADSDIAREIGELAMEIVSRNIG